MDETPSGMAPIYMTGPNTSGDSFSFYDVPFEEVLEGNKRIISQALVSRNVMRPEIEAMMEAYEKSIRSRMEKANGK